MILSLGQINWEREISSSGSCALVENVSPFRRAGSQDLYECRVILPRVCVELMSVTKEWVPRVPRVAVS